MIINFTIKCIFLWSLIISSEQYELPVNPPTVNVTGPLTRSHLDPAGNDTFIAVDYDLVTSIRNDIFCGHPNLEHLYFDINTGFYSPTKKLFECVPNLRTLHFSSRQKTIMLAEAGVPYIINYITMAPDSVVDLAKLEELKLENVGWKKLTKNMFSGEHLKSISVIFPVLVEIDDDTFSSVPNLIHLSVNGSIKSLKPGAFKGLDKLSSLEIRSPLTEFPWDALRALPELENLSIFNQQFKSVDISKIPQQLPRLKVLTMTCDDIQNTEFIKNELKKHNISFECQSVKNSN